MYKFFLWILLASCGQAGSHPKSNQFIIAGTEKDSCDNPDAPINCCFTAMPATHTPIMRIAKVGEPGEKLRITGTVYKADGKTPYGDVILYAYHTDSKGLYSKSGQERGVQKWHGRLHGWCKTDQQGRFELHTIRPAPYPDNSMPAHIHMAIKKPESDAPYYISDFVFKDDSLVTQAYLKSIVATVGGTGIVAVTKSAEGVWTGNRDIVLTE